MKDGGSSHEPPPALLAGLDGLTGADGIDVSAPPTWHARLGAWALPCTLTVASGDVWPLPTRTAWFALIDARYPAGNIDLDPAKDGGITETFPHQSLNAVGADDVPWRTGKLCLDTGSRALGRLGGDSQPLDAGLRLRWTLERALRWVACASRGNLDGPGDLFELPDFHIDPRAIFAFAEDEATFAAWEGAPGKGVCELRALPVKDSRTRVSVVSAFRSDDGRSVREVPWRGLLRDRSGGKPEFGLWLRFPAVPHLPPWKAPETWAELVELAGRTGVDLMDWVGELAGRLRTQERALLLCGFPVRRRIGDVPTQFFWQALRLPPFAAPDKPLKGFRPSERNRILVDRLRTKPDAPILWLTSENWHPETRSLRGRLACEVADSRIAILGAGALGSVVAEVLVRGGVGDLVVVDPQRLSAGNLLRHTLSLSDIGRLKASALVERLAHLSPWVTARAIDAAFPPLDEAERDLLRTAEVLIDCTADDEVAQSLAVFGWVGEPLFLSLSISLDARRLFCYAARGAFPFGEFHPLVAAATGDSREAADQLPREGLGCWHPVAPARLDRILGMAGAAIRYLEDVACKREEPNRLVEFQEVDSPLYRGIQRIP